MAVTNQGRLLAGFVFLAGLCSGCSPLKAGYFLIFGMEPKYEAECPLASDDDEEVKVLILADSRLDTRPEFLGCDRRLAALLGQRLEEGCKKNKEKLAVVPAGQVQKYLEDHPNWKSMSSLEIGAHFQADYVIDLTIDTITMYEPGSHNQLYRGRAGISLAVIDVHKPGEDPIFTKEYGVEYPRTAGPVFVSETNPENFKLRFMNRIATDLSWCFTAHLVDEEHSCDNPTSRP